MGPIAWDWPFRLPAVPPSGGFAQGTRLSGRAGGTGANVARALATRWDDVGMIGYTGRDEWGERSRADLRARGIDITAVVYAQGPTSQVLLLVDDKAERTIIGAVPDALSEVVLDPSILSGGDVLHIAAWHPEFAAAARAAGESAAIVAAVPFEPGDERAVPIQFVVGSRSQLPAEAADDPWATYSSWTGGRVEAVVLTDGANGAVCYRHDSVRTHPALPVDAVDTTGAGDAFAAGLLAAIIEGRPLESGITDGVRWGAASAARDSSVPPSWLDVLAR